MGRENCLAEVFFIVCPDSISVHLTRAGALHTQLEYPNTAFGYSIMDIYMAYLKSSYKRLICITSVSLRRVPPKTCLHWLNRSFLESSF